MDSKIKIIAGGRHTDNRGTLDYVNDFDMSLVKRMYIISHHDTTVLRGWRGHKLEQRWFYVVKGCFDISLIKIDDFENPDPNLEITTHIISEEKPEILHVPIGYASAMRALDVDSKMIVYGDSTIDKASDDNYLYPIDYFTNYKLLVSND